MDTVSGGEDEKVQETDDGDGDGWHNRNECHRSIHLKMLGMVNFVSYILLQ